MEHEEEIEVTNQKLPSAKNCFQSEYFFNRNLSWVNKSLQEIYAIYRLSTYVQI